MLKYIIALIVVSSLLISGCNPEQEAEFVKAWQNMSPEEQQQAQQEIHDFVHNVTVKPLQDIRAAINSEIARKVKERMESEEVPFILVDTELSLGKEKKSAKAGVWNMHDEKEIFKIEGVCTDSWPAEQEGMIAPFAVELEPGQFEMVEVEVDASSALPDNYLCKIEFSTDKGDKLNSSIYVNVNYPMIR